MPIEGVGFETRHVRRSHTKEEKDSQLQYSALDDKSSEEKAFQIVYTLLSCKFKGSDHSQLVVGQAV